MPFQQGQSGNPAGRPRGLRNGKIIMLQNILDNEARPQHDLSIDVELENRDHQNSQTT
jgi:hypothetical protein